MPTRIKFDLPASPSYLIRKGEFVRYTKPDYPLIGVLTITEQRKPGTKVYERRYCVTEVRDHPAKDKLLFKFTKPLAKHSDDPQADNEHWVHIDSRKHITCSCRGFEKVSGFKKKPYCSHTQALMKCLEQKEVSCTQPK